jgi:protein-tyrosine sulfotransferase
MDNSVIDSLVFEIDLLLQKRHEVYPVRDHNYTELIRKISALTTEILGQVEQLKPNWEPDLKLVSITQDFINKPIFICGGMKSGTTLMTQLFDNHPALVVMPGDSTLYTNFNGYTNTFVELSNHWMQRMINPSGKRPFWFLGHDLKAYQDFLLYLQYFLDTPYDTFQSVVASVFCSNPNRSMSAQYWVEKTPENELYALEIKRLYPSAKFIHVLRDPIVNISSIKKMSDLKGYKFHALNYSLHLKRLMDKGIENQRRMGEHIYIFSKYENVVEETEKELKAIAGHLGIEYTPSLLVPTENGVPGIANSMYKESRVLGEISDQGINLRWEKELTKNERIYAVTALHNLALKLGFENWKGKNVQKHYRPNSLTALHIILNSKLKTLKNQWFH